MMVPLHVRSQAAAVLSGEDITIMLTLFPTVTVFSINCITDFFLNKRTTKQKAAKCAALPRHPTVSRMEYNEEKDPNSLNCKSIFLKGYFGCYVISFCLYCSHIFLFILFLTIFLFVSGFTSWRHFNHHL